MISNNPFRLSLRPAILSRWLEKALGIDQLDQLYQDWHQHQANRIADAGNDRVKRFLRYTLESVGIEVTPKTSDAWQQVPATGATIVVSNHPLGGAEGMAMTEQLLQHRSDVLVLTNEILTLIPELSEVFVGVNVLSKTAQKRNARSVKAVCQHLSRGGVLLMYPAGIVSTKNPDTGLVEDESWNRLAGMLAKKYSATVVPCFVEAENSSRFYNAGRIHPRLRTVLLIREMLNKPGSHFPVYVGAAIHPKEFQHLEDDASITQYLRMASDALRPEPEAIQNANEAPILEELELPPSHFDQANVLADLAELDEFKLVEHGSFITYCVPYERLGLLLPELACARERTFRVVGEGSGKASDSDRFDPYYEHLFVWDTDQQRMVGGYRLGRVRDIVNNHGLSCLYSRSLYEFDQAYVDALGNSLEVGRSFVAPEYQRHPRALDMLWQGIGRYVAANPEFNLLFGCVSISNEYSQLARAFLSESMMSSFRAHQAYLNDIKPLKPLTIQGRIWTKEILASLTNIAVINQLVGRIDAGKSVPVLLRHYLTLNGRFVGFSVNEQFQQSLDGLIIVDLRETPLKYLNRYMSKAGAQAFLEKWGMQNAVA